MERSVDGESQKDIFAPSAPGFKKSSMVVACVIGGLFILGSLYQLYKYRRKKANSPGKDFLNEH